MTIRRDKSEVERFPPGIPSQGEPVADAVGDDEAAVASHVVSWPIAKDQRAETDLRVQHFAVLRFLPMVPRFCTFRM